MNRFFFFSNKYFFFFLVWQEGKFLTMLQDVIHHHHQSHHHEQLPIVMFLFLIYMISMQCMCLLIFSCACIHVCLWSLIWSFCLLDSSLQTMFWTYTYKLRERHMGCLCFFFFFALIYWAWTCLTFMLLFRLIWFLLIIFQKRCDFANVMLGLMFSGI